MSPAASPTPSASSRSLAVISAALDAASRDQRSLYRDAVEGVALVLRQRFLSGELRANVDEDFACSEPHPPMWEIETECGRLFIQSPEAAALVLRHSEGAAKDDPDFWGTGDESNVRGGAEILMARDVLSLAIRNGWTTAEGSAGA